MVFWHKWLYNAAAVAFTTNNNDVILSTNVFIFYCNIII